MLSVAEVPGLKLNPFRTFVPGEQTLHEHQALLISDHQHVEVVWCHICKVCVAQCFVQAGEHGAGYNWIALNVSMLVNWEARVESWFYCPRIVVPRLKLNPFRTFVPGEKECGNLLFSKKV